MRVEFHPEAATELTEQALFYEARAAGLGFRFIVEVENAVEILLSHPQIGSELNGIFRCFILNNFPFTLIYKIEPDKVWIMAVAHQSRLPGFWRERIK